MKLASVGPTIFVQACARMMSAAWIERQMLETSTAGLMNLSGVAFALRHTIASEIALGYELALKSLVSSLGVHREGGTLKVRAGHDLLALWSDVPCDTRDEIETEVERLVRRKQLGDGGDVLSFREYLDKHRDFINRAVDNRYAVERGETWMSELLFLDAAGTSLDRFYRDMPTVDGRDVLVAYWYVVMQKAHEHQWPVELCRDDQEKAAIAQEARVLMNRAAWQLAGRLTLMSDDELTRVRFKRWREREGSAVDAAEPGMA